MTTKPQPKPAMINEEARAASLRENLRKRTAQSRLREAQSSRANDLQTEQREANSKHDKEK